MECRDARQALGVYVVGAIEPAERALVDAHLSHCPACREELAGLAGLPSLLGRVPRMDAELIARNGSGLDPVEEPPPELLRSLLRQVDARRRTRWWRGLAAAAAAVIIAVGGGAALDHVLSQHSPAATRYVASAADVRTNVSAVVDYSPSAAGTGMRVKVSGIPVGSACNFWVVDRAGHRSLAGSWTIRISYGQVPWYAASTPVAATGLRRFEITSAGQALVNIPAN